MSELKGPFIDQLDITNFKGIREAHLRDFVRINIFIGRYGCGKSSVLEALDLLTKLKIQNDNVTNDTLNRHGKDRIHEVRDFFHAYNRDNTVRFRIYTKEGREGVLEIKSNEQNESFRFKWQYVNNISEIEVLPNGKTGHSIRNDNSIYTDIPSATFVYHDIIDNLQELDKRLNNLKIVKDEDLNFVNLLRQIFGGIENYETVARSGSGQAPVMFKLPEGRVHIDYLADGMKRVVGLLMFLWERKKQVFLVEEPDHHTYPGIVPNLTETIVKLAHKNDLQLFITTHNPDFLYWLSVHGKEEVKIYHFERQQDFTLQVRQTEWNDLNLMLDMGWDIGNFVRGFQKYVIVEGETDLRVLTEAIKKIKGEHPHKLLINLFYAKDKYQQKELNKKTNILEVLGPLSKKIYILRDLDNQTEEQVQNAVFESFKKSFENKGWQVLNGEFKKGEVVSFKFTKEQVIAVGIPNCNNNIEDYLLQILDSQPELMSELGFDEGTKADAIKKPLIAERIIQKAKNLPEGLIKIIKKIIEDTPPQPSLTS